MIGEIGEVIDVIKKNDENDLLTKENIRKQLIEEMADVLMYYNDIMLCYNISAKELKTIYSEKFNKNMNRW